MNTIPHPEEKGKPMQTEYKGIAITYDEEHSWFTFELRGRERSAPTLLDAKKKIDEPTKEKTFKRCQVYQKDSRWMNGPDWEIVTATSIDAQGHVWVVDKDGCRQKAWSSVYPVNDHNSPIVKMIKELEAQVEALEEQVDKLIEKLTQLK